VAWSFIYGRSIYCVSFWKDDSMGLCVLDVKQFTILLVLLFLGYRTIFFVLAFFHADDDQKWLSNMKKTRSYTPLLIFISVITLYYVYCNI